MTLIARAVIEFLFGIFGIMWKIANPKDKEFERRTIDPSDDGPPTYYKN
jgi:hypothetical protein